MPEECDKSALEVADEILRGASFIRPDTMARYPKYQSEIESIKQHRDALVKLAKQRWGHLRPGKRNYHETCLRFHCYQYEQLDQQIAC